MIGRWTINQEPSQTNKIKQRNMINHNNERKPETMNTQEQSTNTRNDDKKERLTLSLLENLTQIYRDITWYKTR